jgi:tetratricopeptide (TPR) repeat protein
MEQNIFSPRLKQEGKDSLSGTLRSLAQWAVVIIFGLLPIFFIPNVFASLGFTKVYFVSLGLFAAIVFLSLSILRSGSVRVVVPPALALFWLFTVIAVASGLLSGDALDSLYGNSLEVHTAGFIVLMALVMSVSLAFSGAKSAVARLFVALGSGAILLQAFHLLRLIFGPEFLSFGIFNTPTISLIGSFNDLAIFSGLVIIVTLIIMQQISSHLVGRVIASFLVLSSLILLSVINFYAVWLVVGFLSLLMFLYLISKDTWLRGEKEDRLPVPRFVLAAVGLVCLFAVTFIISGDFIGSAINKKTNINYLEIRPSVSATLDITRAVLSENALFGVGPNRFEDAWRQYKNPVINQTIFWNTNFSAGNGYIPTSLITTGLAGGVSFVLFLLAFLYLGYRTLFSIKSIDSGWYLVGTVTFISSLYLWTMAFIYVPGVVIMLLAAFMTGISFAVYTTVVSNTGVTVDVTTNKQYGLLLIAAVLLIIISSTLSTISVSKQFFANVIYADTVRAFQTGADLVTTEQGLLRSQDLSKQDIFVAERAQLRLVELNSLNAADPATVDQQRFATVLSEGISLAEQAVLLDSTNPTNYILLSNFYGLLNPAEFEGLRERNEALFAKARELDGVNPAYLVSMAQYMARIGDLASTRKYLQEAVALKNDFTDALFLLSQLDIQEGKTEDAISLTRSIISIEPTNPTRYFQLGVLLATTNNVGAAIGAFETAVSLDNSYANARYFLALAYLDSGREEDALIQLRIVESTNQDNAVVKELIKQVETGTYLKPAAIPEVPLKNDEGVSQQEDVTTSLEVPDTDLVTPLNNSQTTSEEENSEVVPPVQE